MLSMGKSEVEEGDTHDYFDCGDEYEYARGKTTAECGNCYAQGYYGAAGGRDQLMQMVSNATLGGNIDTYA